jgi:hypothetical protein
MKEKYCKKCFYKHKLVGHETYCKPCQNENSRRNAKNAMYVNGKRIPKSHPLHKPGRYKTFEDAAFSSLTRYESSKEGQVYIITNPSFRDWVKVGMAIDAEDRLNGYQTSSPFTNPSFRDWVKVGMAIDAEDRLNGYQTSSPFRDYSLYKSWAVADRRSAESEAHTYLEKTFDRKGEWFKCTPEEAEAAITGIMESHK